MFKFAAIAVLATVALAQEDDEIVPSEGCEKKTEEFMIEEDSVAVGAACAIACRPEEFAELTEEEWDEKSFDFTNEENNQLSQCRIDCALCSNWGAAAEESASAVVMGATVAFAAAALF